MEQDLQQLSRTAREWVASAEGRRALQEAVFRADRFLVGLQELEEPDPELLAEAASL